MAKRESSFYLQSHHKTTQYVNMLGLQLQPTSQLCIQWTENLCYVLSSSDK